MEACIRVFRKYFKNILLVGAPSICLLAYFRTRMNCIDEVPFSNFLDNLQNNRIGTVICSLRHLKFKLIDSEKYHQTFIPGIIKRAKLWDLLRGSKGIEILDDRQERVTKTFIDYIINLSPIAYLTVLCYFVKEMLKKHMSSDISKKINYLAMPISSKITFSEVAGLGSAKQDFENIIHFLKNREKACSLV